MDVLSDSTAYLQHNDVSVLRNTYNLRKTILGGLVTNEFQSVSCIFINQEDELFCVIYRYKKETVKAVFPMTKKYCS